ncbi:MAG: hypothetical protein O9257_09910 [Brevundimonas sp.]|uniref:hypothetical protein n=1 Tax=Brevundimonas sp. TaxID=1871086 RepID=UPI0022C7D77F|nr:hypothetical protein [Brevundimonas sp.]MCZ8087630.1 hypothetical protein [Brevundimonas sp.]MCZ8194310.1 hypothetical protein [Brevundimonas sp.]
MTVDQTPITQAGINALAVVDFNLNLVMSHRPGAEITGPPYAIVSQREIAEALQRICSSQAVAYACLFDDGHRASEAPRLRNLRLERVRQIRDRCKGVDLTEMRRRGVRNALAHFDERYLKALVDHGGKGGWLQDLALSHKAAIDIGPDAEQRMIRVYVYNEDVLYLFGETLRLKRLRGEIDAILARLGYEIDQSNRPPP